MAGVWKHPDSKHWTAIWYDGQGKKYRESTKLENRKDAQKQADEWEMLEKLGRSGGLGEAQARRVLAQIYERYNGKKLQFYTVKGWFDEWLAGKNGVVEKRTFARYSQVNKDFLSFLDKRTKQSIDAISVQDVREFRDKLRGKGLSAATVNQTVRKMLAAPFMAAQRLGYIQINPCAGVEALKDDEGGGRDPFTIEQVKALLTQADTAEEGKWKDWRGVILFGYHTSLRLRDITDLEWSALDLDAGLLRVKPRKTKRHGTNVVMPLHPDVTGWLKGRERGIGKAKVFPTLAGRPTGGQWALSGLFAKLMEKAEIKGRILRQRKEGGKGRTTSSLSFHSLRHSFISAMANAGVSAELRKKLAGHTDDASHAIYTHHEIETMRAAIDKMPSLSQA